MTASEKPNILVIFFVISGCLLVTLFLHPKVKTFMLPSPIIFKNELSAADRWELNDKYYGGYRLPINTHIPQGPWLVDFPSLNGLSFLQVSILQSKRHYSVDLIVGDKISAQKLASTLNQEATDGTSFSIVRLYSPEEAMGANGYFFEDRSLHNNYWINVSHYLL